jgi:outer membrane protein OmpA-like peptidoglycan-associated protein
MRGTCRSSTKLTRLLTLARLAAPPLLAGLAAGACATSAPPPELVEARATYARAAAGPAASLAAARLRLAKQALDDAELAFGGPAPHSVRTKAYVATRGAETAEAEAQAELLRQQSAEKERLIAELEGQRAEHSEIALESERRARAEAEARAAEAFARLAKEEQLRRDPRGLVLTLSGSVLFASNEAVLLPSAATRLDSVATAIKAANPSEPIVIEGHTDARGGRDHNMRLALARAEAVRAYLVSRGVPAAQLEARGVGPDRPVATNASAEGRANNRRVEIVLPNVAGL